MSEQSYEKRAAGGAGVGGEGEGSSATGKRKARSAPTDYTSASGRPPPSELYKNHAKHRLAVSVWVWVWVWVWGGCRYGLGYVRGGG